MIFYCHFFLFQEYNQFGGDIMMQKKFACKNVHILNQSLTKSLVFTKCSSWTNFVNNDTKSLWYVPPNGPDNPDCRLGGATAQTCKQSSGSSASNNNVAAAPAAAALLN